LLKKYEKVIKIIFVHLLIFCSVLYSVLFVLTGLSDGLICSHEPFVHCIVRNFLEQEGLEELQRTIMELKFCDKNNDLYKFKQVWLLAYVILLSYKQ